MKENLYRKLVLAHVESFMERSGLFPSRVNEKALIGVSGGADSVFLTHILAALFKKKGLLAPGLVHINHGTREENSKEEAFVEKLAESLGLSCKVFHLKMQMGANFEQKARELRYQCFHDALKEANSKTLYLAHMIDDSFEWHWLQKLKSSQYPLSPGIPVRNGVVKRPFHCLSKEQIMKLMKVFKYDYCDDPSNQNLHFERNYLRELINKKIKSRYPSYLKNYVAQANKEAYALGKCAFGEKRSVCELIDCFGGIVLMQSKGRGHFFGLEREVIETIKKLSTARRGELRDQVKKLIEAQATGKRGPLSFSGGVEAYLMPGGVFFIHRSMKSKYINYYNNASQIPDLAQFPLPQKDLQNLPGPFWLIGKPSRKFPKGMSQFSLFENLVNDAKEKGLVLVPLSEVYLKNG